ncbi:hypothetical protein, partial [Cupriavidus metallidurans]|uniref:hypothetical protein n=1 Tax=Cupriavidus metallidurans TaxID=119219 RepID=UPI001BDE4F2D
QYGHVDHSDPPLVPKQASVLYVGQHSMQIPAVGGSGFSANQHPLVMELDRLLQRHEPNLTYIDSEQGLDALWSGYPFAILPN